MDRVINDERTLEFRRECEVAGWRVYMLDDHPSRGLIDNVEGGTVYHWNCIDSNSWISEHVKVEIGARIINSTVLTLTTSIIYGSVIDCNIVAKKISIEQDCYAKNIHSFTQEYSTAVDNIMILNSVVSGSPLWIASKSDSRDRYNVEFIDSQVDGEFLISKSLSSVRCSLVGEFIVSEASVIVDSSLTGAYILKGAGNIIERVFSNKDEIAK